MTDYKGVPVEQIRIEAVRWSEEASKHIRTRSERSSSSDLNIEPTWATEAALDERRVVELIPGKHSDRTSSFRIIGYSPSADRILQVWVYSDEPTEDVWEGASATVANSRLRRQYERSNDE